MDLASPPILVSLEILGRSRPLAEKSPLLPTRASSTFVVQVRDCMIKNKASSLVLLLGVASCVWACGSDNNPAAAVGGGTSTGGKTSAGGSTAVGGKTGTGGQAGNSSVGGATGAGGTTGTKTSVGGSTSAGGQVAVGGSTTVNTGG